ATATYQLLSNGSYLSTANAVSIALAIGLPLAAAAVIGSGIPAAVASASAAAEIFETSIAAEFLSGISVFGVAAGVTAVFVVVASLAAAIIQGINVSNAASLPGKLATLIDTARTTTPDLKTLVSDSSGGTSLFTLFVGVIAPTPTNATCDNSIFL